MKGLILSGGKGTRLRPLTYTAAKQLVPVANKPVLFYAIEDLVTSGITDIGIIVGDTAEQIKTAVGDGARFGARVTYIQQERPAGLAHAVGTARAFLGCDRFVMYLGDNFIREGIAPLVQAFARSAANACILLYRVPNPSNLGVAVLEGDRVVRLVEKPRERISDLAIVGVYMFDHHIFAAVDSIEPSARGELEITDAIQWLIDHGYHVQPHLLDGCWIDTGKMEDMLEANRLVLEGMQPEIRGTVDECSQLAGLVVVQDGAEIHNSILRGPLIIGARTRVSDSYVGPFTAIDHDCVLESVEIANSIVLEHSRIIDIEHRIEDSLIGRYAQVHRSPTRPRAYKLLLGDHSRVVLL
ncbi:MAG TPA: glucose-1-phosphate thymidylyltransferase [Chloroflexota bacterium]|nr:glucose-1-phosphate thymidylyltransferase [Chloroflexota bacterium]